VDMHSKLRSPWEYCPHSTLRNVTQTVEKEFGLVSGCLKLEESCLLLSKLAIFQSNFGRFMDLV